MNDLYDVLGVPKNATQSDIDKAYKEKALQKHPDAGGEHDSFIVLAEAYEILSDPQKRRVYDTSGHTGEIKSVYEAAIETIKLLAAQLIMLPQLNSKQDIINIVMDHVAREIKNAKNTIRKNKDLLLKFGQMKSTVHSKTDRNLIHEVLDDAIQKIANSIKNDQKRISICKACQEILKDYSYGLIQIPGL